MLDVGVIITSYNRAQFLHEALSSVFAQTLLPREIIVVDDGGADGSEAVVSAFNGVKYVWQPNSGCASARNRGAKLVESELIAFLDDDDIWLPNKLQIQSEFLSNENYDLTFSHGHEFMQDQENADSVRIRTEAPFILPSALLANRQAFWRVGNFDEKLRTGGELIDWYARAEDAGLAIGMCNTALIKRRVHGTNCSSTKTRDHTRYTVAVKQIIDRRRQASEK